MKDKDLLQHTREMLENYQADKLRESLVELYFSYTSVTSDHPIQFKDISQNVYGLITFLNKLSGYEKEDDKPVRKRKPRNKPPQSKPTSSNKDKSAVQSAPN